MVFYSIKTPPPPPKKIPPAPGGGGGTNKAVTSPINLTFSSVPEPASKLSYLGERGEPRENARASAKPRRAEERSFPHPSLSRLLSSGVPLARLRFTIFPKWRACSEARRLSVPLHRARKFKNEKKLRSNEPHLFSFNFSNSQNREFSH